MRGLQHPRSSDTPCLQDILWKSLDNFLLKPENQKRCLRPAQMYLDTLSHNTPEEIARQDFTQIDGNKTVDTGQFKRAFRAIRITPLIQFRQYRGGLICPRWLLACSGVGCTVRSCDLTHTDRYV